MKATIFNIASSVFTAFVIAFGVLALTLVTMLALSVQVVCTEGYRLLGPDRYTCS